MPRGQTDYGFGQGLVDAFPVAVSSLFRLRDQALEKEKFGLEREKFDYLQQQAEQDRLDKSSQLSANPGIRGQTAQREPAQGLISAEPTIPVINASDAVDVPAVSANSDEY